MRRMIEWKGWRRRGNRHAWADEAAARFRRQDAYLAKIEERLGAMTVEELDATIALLCDGEWKQRVDDLAALPLPGTAAARDETELPVVES